MKYLIFLFVLLTASMVVAEELKFDPAEESNKTLQQEHMSLLSPEMERAEHSFSMSVCGKVIGERVLATASTWSIFKNEKGFSMLLKDGDKKIHVQTNVFQKQDAHIFARTECRISIKEKVYVLKYDIGLPTNENFSGLNINMNKKATNIEQTEQIFATILKKAEIFYQGMLSYAQGKTDPFIEATQSVAIAMDMMIASRLEVSREIVSQNFSWSVSYPQSNRYGNGKVQQFHLLIKSGSGVLRHEIIGGYLFITAVIGNWSGTGWIWQES